MDYYTATILLTVVSMLIVILSVFISSAYSKQKKIQSTILCLIVIICAICEWAGVKLSQMQVNKNLHIFVKWLELSLAPSIGILPCFILSKNDIKFGKVEIVLVCIVLINVILETISSFTGFIFNVDDTSYYSHGSFYFLYLLTYGISMLYFIYSCVRIFKNRNIKYLIPMFATAIFILFSIIIQAITNLKIDWLTISIGLVFMLKFYGDILSNTDGLTDLLNRTDFDNTIKNLYKQSVIVYFDVNDFKNINDTYGHLYGDKILIKIAKILKKVYAPYGKIYRYGGDEFCVLLTKNINKYEELNKQFFDEVLKEHELNPNFPIVSLGSASYEPNNDQIIDVLDKADQEMYKNKIETKQLNTDI